MKYNRSEIVDPDRSLESYLNADLNKARLYKYLAKEYQHLFYRFNRLSCEFRVDKEYISPLECAAMRGSIKDVTNILSPSRRNVVSFLREQNPLSTYQKQAAFFRALEHKNIDVAHHLLHDHEVKYAATHITIEYGNFQLQKKYPFLRSMLSRLVSPLVMNGIRERGNLALILAAKSGDFTLFNNILNTNTIQEQLTSTAIPAFVCMTRTKDSETVSAHELNIDILSMLLDKPNVNRYAISRIFDYEEILIIYTKNFDLNISNNKSYKTLADLAKNPDPGILTRNTSSALFSSPTTTEPESFTPITDNERIDDTTPVVY